MKKILLSLMFIFILSSSAFANNVSNLDYYVDINEDGSAYITQIWEGQFTSGTENYIPIKCDDFSISEYKVKDSRGIEYINRGDKWDVNASKEEKAYSYGIHKVGGNEVELCWGIGDYGYTTYEISYKISSLVKRCSDGVDGFNFWFVNDNMSTFPTNLDMRIRMVNGKEINENNAKVWAFGFDGRDIFQDGEIRVTTIKKLSGSDYVKVCSRLDGLVNPLEKNSRSFEEIINTAKQDSEYNINNDDKNFYKTTIVIAILGTIISIMCGMIPFFVIISAILGVFNKNLGDKIIMIMLIIIGLPFVILGLFFIFCSNGSIRNLFIGILVVFFGYMIMQRAIHLFIKEIQWKKIIKGVEYNREVSENFSENSYIVNKFGYFMGVNKENTYIGAIIMKMLLNGNLMALEREEIGFLGKEKKIVDLKFIKEPVNIDEQEIYYFLRRAGNSKTKDDILQNDELQGFCKRHYKKYFTVINNIFNRVEDKLILNGKIINEKKINNINKGWSEEGRKQIKKLVGLKKYLNDFTLLNEREISEIKNWEMMLVYATLFGISEKIIDKFEIIIPDEQVYTNVSSAVIMSSVITKDITRGTNMGRTMDSSRRASSSSSGGGGFSSHSGGGGSSGGGHGGGSR